MNILIIGSGGRENAIGWKTIQSNEVKNLIFAPGNPGAIKMLQHWSSVFKKGVPIEVSSIEWKLDGAASVRKLVELAIQRKVDLVIVGNDDALAAGVVDAFENAKVPVFGPTKAAARLESSKCFAKEVMTAAQIPTAAYQKHQNIKSLEQFKKIIDQLDWSHSGWVIKADGLALGKGVVVCEKQEDAYAELSRLLRISSTFIIEEKVGGPQCKEVSLFGLCDGHSVEMIGAACDYKRLLDGDAGPNTGGMGAYSPVPWITEAFIEKVKVHVFQAVLEKMKAMGVPYKGILYAGLMVEEDQYWVLEFNARFGDPEAQVLLPLWNVDFVERICLAIQGKVKRVEPSLNSSNCAVVVTGASPGYPESPETGFPLRESEEFFTEAGLPRVYFAGVQKNPSGKGLLSSGGRVLYGVGFGPDFGAARKNAYSSLRKFGFENMIARADIAIREEVES